jgi:site-specific recombinase XerD
MNIASDYIEFDIALNKGKKLLNDEKKCRIGFLIILGINVGLRINEILSLKHSDLQDNKLVIKEKKTGKKREISLNANVLSAYSKLLLKLNNQGVKVNEEDFIFVSQKGTVYRTQSVNVLLKKIFNSKTLAISSHSLRKSFSRRVFDNNNQSESSLILLSQLLNHESISCTRRYLGLRKETIENVYLTL